MLPWIYEFRWDAGHIIFLGVFYAVVATIIVTVVKALMRARKDFTSHRDTDVLWKAAFEDLAKEAKTCRHEFLGDVKQRTCDHEFDCRTCETHAAWLAKGVTSDEPRIQAAQVEQILGLRMPLDRLYHRGHTWVRPEVDGTISVGLDDFARRLVGTADGVVLPKVGQKVHVNGTGWKFRKKDSEIRILCPVDGEVVAARDETSGWHLRVKPEGDKIDFRHLFGKDELKPWLTREMERLQAALSSRGVGVSLADGGVPVDDMPASYKDADWDAIWGEMFLEN
ncbi:MAG: hypothetical protein WBD36_15165 [Bacteroidota bacterium]